MYSACIFCHGSLGANEAIAHFPVGRRLAFDAAKGRLWVVCRKCGRWNLTPAEERWEAIEECERAFRGTRLRASTDNIGLAKLREGTELVRVGAPLLPEMASWRYVSTIRRRRVVAWAGVTAGFVAQQALTYGANAIGMFGAGGLVYTLFVVARGRPLVCRVTGHDAKPILVRPTDLQHVAWRPAADGMGWKLLLHAPRRAWRKERRVIATIEGSEATAVGARMLARLNRMDGSKYEVGAAVRLLQTHGSPLDDPWLAVRALAYRARGRNDDWYQTASDAAIRDRVRWEIANAPDDSQTRIWLHDLPPEQRLALEIAANDDAERRAMQGELAALEAAWREAEEVGSIADDLLLPAPVLDGLARLRGRGGARTSREAEDGAPRG